jgi:hypothetical protein
LLDEMPRGNVVYFNLLLIDANSHDVRPDASLETFKRAHRAAGVKAERFTYASVRRPPAVCRRQGRPKRVQGA